MSAPEPVLSAAQVRRYLEQGFLQVSGLIPADVVERARAAMWRCTGADPDDPATWAAVDPGHAGYEDPDLVALYTEAVCTAAWQLSEGEVDRAHFQPPARSVYAINYFPEEGDWAPHGPHIDHSIEEHGHETFPPAFRVALMTFLNDVAEDGGGTVVWPGSHHRIEALARSDPQKYRMMWQLGRDLDKADIGEPERIVPRAGDVLFYHVFCAHSGSRNVSAVPRFALNRKW
jgi:hypothetical protein